MRTTPAPTGGANMKGQPEHLLDGTQQHGAAHHTHTPVRRGDHTHFKKTNGKKKNQKKNKTFHTSDGIINPEIINYFGCLLRPLH